MKKILIGIALISTLFLNACSGSLTASILDGSSIATDDPQDLEDQQKTKAYEELCSDVTETLRELKKQKELFKSRYTSIEFKQREAENSLFGSRDEGQAASARTVLGQIRQVEANIQKLEELQKNLPCPTGSHVLGYFENYPEDRDFCKNIMAYISALGNARSNLIREILNEERAMETANYYDEQSKINAEKSLQAQKDRLKEVEKNLKEAVQSAFLVYLCKRYEYHNSSPILIDAFIKGLIEDGVIKENDLPTYVTYQPCEFYREQIEKLQEKLKGLSDFHKPPTQKELQETMRKFLTRCEPKDSELNLISYDLVCEDIVERALAVLKEFQKSGSAAALIKFEDLRNIYYEYCVGEDVPYFDDDLQLGLMDLFVNGEISREELGEYSRDDDLDYPLEKDCKASKQDLRRALRLQKRALGEKKQKLDQEIKDLIKRIKKLCPKDDVGEFIDDLSDEELSDLDEVSGDETVQDEINERDKIERDIAIRKCEDIKEELGNEMFAYVRSTGPKKANALKRIRELIDAYINICDDYEDAFVEIYELISENDGENNELIGALPELYDPETFDPDQLEEISVNCGDIENQLKKISEEIFSLSVRSNKKTIERDEERMKNLEEKQNNLKRWKASHCKKVEREANIEDQVAEEEKNPETPESDGETTVGLIKDEGSTDGSESGELKPQDDLTDRDKEIVEEMEQEFDEVEAAFAGLIASLIENEECLDYLERINIADEYLKKSQEAAELLLQLKTPRFREGKTAFMIYEDLEKKLSELKDEWNKLREAIEKIDPCPPEKGPSGFELTAAGGLESFALLAMDCDELYDTAIDLRNRILELQNQAIDRIREKNNKQRKSMNEMEIEIAVQDEPEWDAIRKIRQVIKTIERIRGLHPCPPKKYNVHGVAREDDKEEKDEKGEEDQQSSAGIGFSEDFDLSRGEGYGTARGEESYEEFGDGEVVVTEVVTDDNYSSCLEFYASSGTGKSCCAEYQ